MKRTVLQLMVLGIAFAGFGWAEEEDTPGRGVARISLINGDVSIRRGDSGDWVAAAVNAPVVVYDHVLAGTGSRAEVQFDYANMIRLRADSEIRIAELENRRYQVQVARGTVTLRVLRETDADMEIDTPNVSVRPVKKGIYRITVREDGESEVTVRSGEAETSTPRGVERVHSGRTMLVRGTAADPEFQIVNAVAYDDWDRWNEERDRRLERSRAYQYVSRDIYGADDLDYYGRWIYDAPYGWVWSPYGVGTDWAPYRYGRWSWLDWYGWSWVSYDPWGWAPYHYGRWYWGPRFGWCWFPGPIYHRYFWRPALVGFFGWGHGIGIGFGFGNIGWVPLAPYEPYYPWYGRRWYGGYRNTTVINNIRVVNNTNISNIYRNARIVNGVTAIDAGDFARGVRGRTLPVADTRAQRFSLVQGPVPVIPGRDSLRVSDRPAPVVQVGRTEPARFYTRREPARVERIPFEEQRRGMEQVVARSFAPAAGQPGGGAVRAIGEREVRGGTPGAVVSGGNVVRLPAERAIGAGAADSRVVRIEPGNNAPRTTPQTSWRAVPEEPRAPANQAAPSWRRFGEPPGRQDAGAVRGSEAQPGRAPEPARVERRAEENVRRGGQENNWQRFGQAPAARQETPAAGREAPARRQDVQSPTGETWQRFGAGHPQERVESPARTEMPRSEPRTEAPRFQSAPRFDRPEPIRINPPIVRERAAEAPRVERGGGGGGAMRMGGGGGGAPRGGGGESRGGGGAARSEGGGGRGRR